MRRVSRLIALIAFIFLSTTSLWGDAVYPPHTIGKYNQAVELYNSGKLEEAGDLFVIIVRETSMHPELFEIRVMSTQYLGIIYRDLKDYERSNKWFHAAVGMVNKNDDFEQQENWKYVLANEIKINHELITLVKDKQNMKEERRQNRTAALLIFSALLLLMLSICSYLIHQLRKANRALAEKNLEWSQRFSVFESPGKEQADSLKEITDYIENEKAYLKPDFCLDDLCMAVGRNRSYISREFSRRQTSFKSFVNKYRVKEAIMLLVSRPEMSIDEVWESSGFNSRTTFYNTFNEATGLSPSAFRKANLKNPNVPQDE